MDFKERDLFIEFLGNNGVNAPGGMVSIEDAHKIQPLYREFLITLASKHLPAELADSADKVVSVVLEDFPREGQDETKYEVKLLDSYKNDDLWGGTANGAVKDLWKFLTQECKAHPDAAEEALKESIDGESGILCY